MEKEMKKQNSLSEELQGWRLLLELGSTVLHGEILIFQAKS
jgi:hypothetical protein